VSLATAFCKTFLLRMLNDSLKAETQLRVVVRIEEEDVTNKILDQVRCTPPVSRRISTYCTEIGRGTKRTYSERVQ
jgi:hypothetical protein